MGLPTEPMARPPSQHHADGAPVVFDTSNAAGI